MEERKAVKSPRPVEATPHLDASLSNETTPGTPQHLISEILRTSKGILLQIKAMLSILQSPDDTKDMLDLGSQVLAIDSHFISDMFGGPHVNNVNDQLIGYARLYYCCHAAKDGVLVPNRSIIDQFISDDASTDNTADLSNTSLMKGVITAAFSGGAIGDPNGFPVMNLINFNDQQLLCNINAYFVANRDQHAKYDKVNKRGRKLYENTLGDIFKRVLEFHPDFQEHNSCINIPDLAYTYQFKDLSAYTYMVLEELLLHKVFTEQECIYVAKLYCDSIETIFKYMLPKLGNVFKTNDEAVDEILSLLIEINAWWKNSPYIPLRDFVFGKNYQFIPEKVLSEYQKGNLDLPTHITKLLNQLNESNKHIPQVMCIHPTSDADTLSPIHTFSYNLLIACGRINPHALNIQQLAGISDSGSKVGFTYAFDKLVETFNGVYSLAPPITTVDSSASKRLEGAANKKNQGAQPGASSTKNRYFQPSDPAAQSNTAARPRGGSVTEQQSRRSLSISSGGRSPRSPRSKATTPNDSPRAAGNQVSSPRQNEDSLRTSSGKVGSPRSLLSLSGLGVQPYIKSGDTMGSSHTPSPPITPAEVRKAAAPVELGAYPSSPQLMRKVQLRNPVPVSAAEISGQSQGGKSPKPDTAQIEQYRKSPKPSGSLRRQSLRAKYALSQIQEDLKKSGGQDSETQVGEDFQKVSYGQVTTVFVQDLPTKDQRFNTNNMGDDDDDYPPGKTRTPGSNSSGSTD